MERSNRFKKMEKIKPFSERIESLFEILFLRYKRDEKMMYMLRRECDDLKTSLSATMEDFVGKYVNFVYNNGGKFVSFTQFYEEFVKTREEKITELFEQNRFVLMESTMLMNERDKILSNPDVTFDQVRHYLQEIKDSRMFRPFESSF